MEEKIYCSHCGGLIETDDYDLIGDEPICSDCVENFTTTCDCCGEIIWIVTASVTNIHHSARTVTITITPAAATVTYFSMRTTHTTLTATNIAVTAMMKNVRNASISTNTATNPNPSSTENTTVTLALNWKLTEQAKMMTVQKKSLILRTIQMNVCI